ncbi:signal transducer and activator of transcription 5B-like protein [Leptotrombidium deliense]|uniref:Signal transducer and activator of transcription n=1 Tax=Leptotrombidium deliense TaxID=299467 RepID=A0A443SD34_9ACAR|nr:signal transducer and activator of transcription 5B-like protein [Leptotrombidium deliense]
MQSLLWKKVQKLPEHRKQYLATLYDKQFPYVIRSTLPHFFEAAHSIDTNEPQYQEYANKVLSSFIQALEVKCGQNPSNFELLTATETLSNIYYDRSTEFLNKARNIFEHEMSEVIINMANSYYGAEITTVAEIAENLELLKRREKQCDYNIRRLNYEKGQYLIEKQNLKKRQTNVQQFVNSGQQMNAIVERYEAETLALEIDFKSQVSFFIDKIKKSIQNIEETNSALKCIQNYVLNHHLNAWINNQKLHQIGYEMTNNLPVIESWCESIAEMLWNLKHHLVTQNEICIIFDKTLQEKTVLLRNDVINQIKNLVSATFIVYEQPPQVIKTDTQFEANVRFLIGRVLYIDMIKPTVTASLVNEVQRRNWTQASKLLESCSKLCNNESKLEGSVNNSVNASFKNMKLTKPKRAEKKSIESVMDEKFALLFQSEFTICSEIAVNVSCFSLPIAVTVHGNQEPKAWPTILWDNAFSSVKRLGFDVPEKVPWKKLADALSKKFKKDLGSELNAACFNYLAAKLFQRDSFENFDEQLVSWAMFTKDHLKETNFTFSEWIFSALKLAKDHLKYLWLENHLCFINKEDAEQKLLLKPQGTFLLRFCDSALGAVSIATYGLNSGIIEVYMLGPLNAKDFKALTLADTVMDLYNLTHLYPNIPKNVVFGKHSSVNDERNQGTRQTRKKPYVKVILTASIPQSREASQINSISYALQQSALSELRNKSSSENDADLEELMESLLDNDFYSVSGGADLNFEDVIESVSEHDENFCDLYQSSVQLIHDLMQ